MNAKLILTAFCAAILGAFVGQYFGSGDGRPTEGDLPTHSVDADAARELREAAIAIKDAAIALDKASRIRPAAQGAQAAPTVTPESAPTLDASLATRMDRWMAAMERLVAVSAMPTGADKTPMREWSTLIETPAKALVSRFANDQEATRALLLLTQRQVLQLIGAPESLSGSGDGVVWNYPDGCITFRDGLVAYVGVYTPSEEDESDGDK